MANRPLKILTGIVIGMASLGGLIAVVALRLDPGLESGSSSTDATIGDTHYMGASNCDKAIKTQLTDPDSYQRIATQIVDVKPGTGWVARTAFRSRNGFGGYREATADCLFDGNSYRAIVMQ
jgi:hypothetical protein